MEEQMISEVECVRREIFQYLTSVMERFVPASDLNVTFAEQPRYPDSPPPARDVVCFLNGVEIASVCVNPTPAGYQFLFNVIKSMRYAMIRSKLGFSWAVESTGPGELQGVLNRLENEGYNVIDWKPTVQFSIVVTAHRVER